MSFATAYLEDPQNTGGGERVGIQQLVLTATSFEDALKVGRFAKLDTGRLDNMDGSGTPVIAGVVLRKVSNPVEDAATIDAQLYSQVEYLRQGLVQVDVKSGETPTKFGKVYASNAGNASDGLATATASDVYVNAEFVEEVQAGVWLIYVTPAPGDVATHISDATAAHAASAISVADAGGFTANATVEAVLAEMLPATAGIAAIADPGASGAIPVLRSGCVALTSGGSETRTLAAPATVGITLDITHNVDGGAIVVTAASAINQAGNNTMTFTEVNDYIRLVSVLTGGTIKWRVVANDVVVLTTV